MRFIDSLYLLVFIDSFQFLSSSLDSLVKHLDYLMYLSEEFDSEVLDLVKQKGFCTYEHMCDSEKFTEHILAKIRFTVH